MLGSLARRIVDSVIFPMVRRLNFRLGTSTVVGAMQRISIERSAAYATDHMKSSMLFEDLAVFRTHTFKKRFTGGLNLEFGVHRGRSINLFASLTDELLYGFDSFEGLQEDWAGSIGAVRGYFDQSGNLPKVKENVRLIKGWFQKTLPPFLEKTEGVISFVNVDCDTYESSSYVLNAINKKIVVGTIIIFDEYFGYPGWEVGEHKAWIEFCSSNRIQSEYVAICEGRVSVKVVARG